VILGATDKRAPASSAGIETLLADMRASIDEADRFLTTLPE